MRRVLYTIRFQTVEDLETSPGTIRLLGENSNTLHGEMDSNVCEQLSLPLTSIVAVTQDDSGLLDL